MKNILVPFSDDPATRVAVQLACRLAKHTGGVIDVLRAIEPPHVIVNDIVPAAYVTQLHEQQLTDGETLKASLQEILDEADIPLVERHGAVGENTAVWVEANGREDFIIGDFGRLFDLIIVARRPSRVGGDWTATLEAALFESGRPALLAPPTLPDDVGKHIVIAWNGSTETAMAIALSMPFLIQAEKVTLLTVDGSMVPGPDGHQMAERLKRHGINVVTADDDQQGRQAGEAILEDCGRLNGDMLIKGAYTQSRLRQLIFGGATQHIILNAEIPVFLAR